MTPARFAPLPARFPRDRFTLAEGELVACASDLGWPAGGWAKVVVIDGIEYRRDWPARQTDREGELLSVPYVPALNGHPPLTLFND